MALVNGRGIVNGYRIEPGADLIGADLAGASLLGANLNSANLEGADLTGAYLVQADLRHADLRGATLTRAVLAGADFREAKVDAHHVPLIEAAYRDMINSLKVGRDGRTSAPGYGRTSASGRKVISPDLTGVNAAEAAEREAHQVAYEERLRAADAVNNRLWEERDTAEAAEREYASEYAMGDEETVVGIVPVHIYSDGKRVYFFSDVVEVNEFLKTLPPSIKSRAKIGNHFSSTTVTLYPPGRTPNPGYGHHRGYGRRR